MITLQCSIIEQGHGLMPLQAVASLFVEKKPSNLENTAKYVNHVVMNFPEKMKEGFGLRVTFLPVLWQCVPLPKKLSV